MIYLDFRQNALKGRKQDMGVRKTLTTGRLRRLEDDESISSYLAYITLQLKGVHFGEKRLQELVNIIAQDSFISALALKNIPFLTEKQKTQLSAATTA